MKAIAALLAGLGLVCASGPALAQASPEPGKKLVEIFKIAPGKHAQFLRAIAAADALHREAGAPVRDLYVHGDGADWDFLIIQNGEHAPGQGEALFGLMARKGVPMGVNYFVTARETFAAHTDSFVYGPTSAAVYLSGLDSEKGKPVPTPVPFPPREAGKVERKLIEIYKIAPGRHVDFLRQIAVYDEANRRVGLPPRELYVHQDGADWDFMLIQPAASPPGKGEALDRELKALKVPTGINYFVKFRENIASHTDTFVSGPTTAEAYSKDLK